MDAIDKLFAWAEDNHYLTKTNSMIKDAAKQYNALEAELTRLKELVREGGMDKWKCVGDRYIPSLYGTLKYFAISVPHPNGDWEAIYCKTSELAEEIVRNKTELTRLKALVKEMGSSLAFATLAIETLSPESKLPNDFRATLARPEVKAIMEDK